MAGSPPWAGQDYGLYSPTFELVLDCGSLRTLPQSGDPAIPLQGGARRDGRSHAPVLRCGGGSAE